MKICRSCKEEKSLDSFYANKTNCKTCVLLINKKWRDNNQEKKKTLNTDWWYKNRYGISYEKFREVCSKQQDQCKICGVSLEFKGKNHKSAVQDHDHETGKLRGVLCNSCNIGLGHFKDSKHNLTQALNYLQEYEN